MNYTELTNGIIVESKMIHIKDKDGYSSLKVEFYNNDTSVTGGELYGIISRQNGKKLNLITRTELRQIYKQIPIYEVEKIPIYFTEDNKTAKDFRNNIKED